MDTWIKVCISLFQVETLMRDMDNIFIKSLQAVQKVMINDKHCFELYPFIVAVCENVFTVRHIRSFSVVIDFHHTTLTIHWVSILNYPVPVTSWDRPFLCYIIFISNLWWHCRPTQSILTRCIANTILIPDILMRFFALIGHVSKQPLL